MNGDGGQIIVRKKDKNIDDDGPVSKKKQKNQRKNQNKTLNQQAALEEYQKKNTGQQQKCREEKKVKNQNDKIYKNVQQILPNHRPETVWKVLQKNHFKQHQALAQLMDIPEDAAECSLMSQFDEMPSKPPDKVEEEMSPNEAGTQILEQIFQTGLDIDKTEFQELFQEIATIIKKDQQEKGATMLQINEFVDDCFLIKKVLFLQNSDICLDENDPLVIQTQVFLEELIKNKVTEEKKRQNDFPTLGSIRQNKNGSNGKNYFQKIHEGYKQDRKKEEYFVPSKTPTQFFERDKKSNIYAVNEFDEYQSSVDVQSLSKQYKGFSIDKLKFIYTRLLDLNLCKTFLDRYYSHTKTLPQKIQQPKYKVEKKTYNSSNKKAQSMSEKVAKIDKEYKNVCLDDVREELDHLFKRRQLFKMTRGKITNIAHRKQLQRLSCRDDPTIRKLSQIARYKLVEEMAESHPQELDLHGYRQEEIDDVLYEVEKMVKKQYKSANSLLKTRKMNSEVFCIVKVITGKGLHSKYGKSILKPTVISWSEAKGLQCTVSDDSIDVYFRLL